MRLSPIQVNEREKQVKPHAHEGIEEGGFSDVCGDEEAFPLIGLVAWDSWEVLVQVVLVVVVLLIT